MEPRLEGPTRVLLAEDDEALREAISKALRAEGYHVIEVTSGLQLRDWLHQSLFEEGFELAPDLVIAGVRMPGGSGLDVLSWLREHDWDLPVILLTASGDRDFHLEAARLDVDDLICAATLLAEPRPPPRPTSSGSEEAREQALPRARARACRTSAGARRRP